MTTSKEGVDATHAVIFSTFNNQADAGFDLLDGLLTNAPVGIGFVDRELRYLRVNAVLAAINGVPVEQHTGRTVREVIPEIAPTLEPLLNGVLHSGEAILDLEITAPHPTRAGERGTWLVSYYPGREQSGIVQGVGILVTDITARKQTETLLCESEKRFHEIAEAMPQIMWTASPEGIPDYFNSRWREYTGHAGLGHGEGWSAFIHPDDLAATMAEWNSASQSGNLYEREVRLRMADETYKWFLVRAVAGRDAEGSIRKWYVTATDIDAYKQAQAQVALLNARLHRAVYEASHRIKNHLQVLAALVDMQVTQAQETIPVEEMKRIGAHIRALSTIHDILTDSAKRDAEAEHLSAKALLEQLLTMLRQAAGNHRVTFAVEEARLPVRLSTTLTLILNELVSNAIKHGRAEAHITFGVSEGKAMLMVCDDGPGFPIDFDPRQAANTGLELVEQMVCWDLKGMTHYAKSAAGGGQVTITFPLPV